MKIYRSVLAGACMAVLVPHAAMAQTKSLTIVSYGGNYTESQRQAYYLPFEGETGIKVVTDDAVEVWPQVRAQVEADDVRWDVVNGETATIILGCDTGLLEPIDWSKIDKSKIHPDAIQECGVGTIVQSSVLAFDADRFNSDPPKTVADFWNLEKYPGKRGLRKTPITTLEFALVADGVPHTEVYDVLAGPEGVDRAFAKLDELRDSIIWWESSSSPPQLLADGEVAMTSSWSGRITQANRSEGKNFKIIWDGQNYDIDFWAIVAGSKNFDAAMDFIALASRPDRQAEQMKYIAYGPTNKDALPLLPPELDGELPSHTQNLKTAVKNNSDFWAENLEQLQRRFFAWIHAS